MGSPPRKSTSSAGSRAKTPSQPAKKKATGSAKPRTQAKPKKAAKSAARPARPNAEAKPKTKPAPKSKVAAKPKAKPKPAPKPAPKPKKEPVPEFLVDGPAQPPRTLILAHGAGSPMDSPFLETLAKGVAGYGFRVVRFEFPYMRKRRETRKKGVPDREPVLIERFKQVIKKFGGPKGTIIGGKSMGGRIATLIADELGVDGVVCLGYPFHPSGKPQDTRTGHLAELRTPTLIIQGERDPFGTREEIRGYPLSWHIQVAYLPGGDHSFKPPKDAETTEKANLDEACRLAATFCRRPNLPPAPLFD